MTPWDMLKVISETKTLGDIDDNEFENAYVPFLINRGLSFYPDTVLLANEMNMNSHAPKRWQYAYLYHTVKPRKRYAKWLKKSKVDDDNLELIKQYFGYNTAKAKQALSLLNESQIKTIKEHSSKGGIVVNVK